MSEFDVDGMIEAIRLQLEQQGAKMQGLSLEDLRAAISHPEAGKQILEMLALESTSVKVGDPAPDFTLPRLGGANAGELVTLSSHFSRRPVALVFGSYT